MLSAYDQKHLDDLVFENQSLLDRFSADGVPMDRAAEITVRCEFDTRKETEACRASMREIFSDREFWKSQGKASEEMYIVCNMKRDVRPFELAVNYGGVPNAREISVFEFVMMKASYKHDGGEVFWEFEDPRNADVTKKQRVN